MNCGCCKLEFVLAQVPKAVPDTACGTHVWGMKAREHSSVWVLAVLAEGIGNSLAMEAMVCDSIYAFTGHGSGFWGRIAAALLPAVGIPSSLWSSVSVVSFTLPCHMHKQKHCIWRDAALGNRQGDHLGLAYSSALFSLLAYGTAHGVVSRCHLIRMSHSPKSSPIHFLHRRWHLLWHLCVAVIKYPHKKEFREKGFYFGSQFQKGQSP